MEKKNKITRRYALRVSLNSDCGKINFRSTFAFQAYIQWKIRIV